MEALNVMIGIRHYTYLPESNEVFVKVEDVRIETKGDHLRRGHWRIIKHHSPRWLEVKRLALRK